MIRFTITTHKWAACREQGAQTAAHWSQQYWRRTVCCQSHWIWPKAYNNTTSFTQPNVLVSQMRDNRYKSTCNLGFPCTRFNTIRLSVTTFSPSICSLVAPWILSREKRSLKCPIHWTSTPALLWMTLKRASSDISTWRSLSACWLCLLVSTSLAVICIRE